MIVGFSVANSFFSFLAYTTKGGLLVLDRPVNWGINWAVNC